MPILHRLSRSKICLYPGDHLPPHFHVRFNDGREALVAIETLEVLGGGRRARELKFALEWAAENRDVLMRKWRELNP